MAFADISYFGDGGSFGGIPSWSGRISSASELDRFDWGAGRKTSFGSFGNRTAFDMERMIDDAVRRQTRSIKRNGLFDGSDVVTEINRKDRMVGGAMVPVKSVQEDEPDDSVFSVSGATASASFPFVSRLAKPRSGNGIDVFIREKRLSGIGRTVGVTGETKMRIPIESSRPGTYFYLDEDESGKLFIRNCKVFLGCLGFNVECDDVEVDVGDGEDATYYLHVDFTVANRLPVVSVDSESGSPEESRGVFTAELYVFRKGACVRGNGQLIILPTYSFYAR